MTLCIDSWHSLALYSLLLVNLLTFIVYIHDKWKARHPRPHGHPHRTPEATLLLLAALGGSIGALLAMHLFRHKTLHRKFTIGIPALLAVQMAAAALLLWVG